MSKRSRHQSGGQWIRPEKRLAIYLRDRFHCLWCRRDLTDRPGQLTLDHWTSRARGGSNEATNLLTSCRDCNSRRRERTAAQFAREVYEKVFGHWTELRDGIRRQMRRSLRRHLIVARELLRDLGVSGRTGKRDLSLAVLRGQKRVVSVTDSDGNPVEVRPLEEGLTELGLTVGYPRIFFNLGDEEES